MSQKSESKWIGARREHATTTPTDNQGPLRTCSTNADRSVHRETPSMSTPRRCAEKIAFMHAMYCPGTSAQHCTTKMRHLWSSASAPTLLSMQSALLSAAEVCTVEPCLPGEVSACCYRVLSYSRYHRAHGMQCMHACHCRKPRLDHIYR